MILKIWGYVFFKVSSFVLYLIFIGLSYFGFVFVILEFKIVVVELFVLGFILFLKCVVVVVELKVVFVKKVNNFSVFFYFMSVF